MLDLLKSTENVLLFSLWCISAALVVSSVVMALWLSIRRVRRNKLARQHAERQQNFETFLQEALSMESLPKNLTLSSDIRSDRTVVTSGLLRFFKIVSGEDALKLKQIIKQLDLESVVQAAITWGNRGKRMRAFHVLSFLDTSSSLKTVCEHLYSPDKYVRLSVARCIARRRVLSLISEVAEAVTFAFPKDEKILADVLSRFGVKAIPHIQEMAKRNSNPTIIAGVLETLVLLRPENCELELGSFIEHEDERIRAAAVELSSISRSVNHTDLLELGLRDDSRKVKIRSLKVATRQKRKDLFADIYRLMNDPFIWVRYWAMQAALNTGQSGETLMRSLTRQTSSIGNLAVDVMKER